MTPDKIPAEQKETSVPSNASFLAEGGSTDNSTPARHAQRDERYPGLVPGEAEGEGRRAGRRKRDAEEEKESGEKLREAGAKSHRDSHVHGGRSARPASGAAEPHRLGPGSGWFANLLKTGVGRNQTSLTFLCVFSPLNFLDSKSLDYFLRGKLAIVLNFSFQV